MTAPDYPEFGPDNVNVNECGGPSGDDVHEHHCIHDWRIHWGNVPRRFV